MNKKTLVACLKVYKSFYLLSNIECWLRLHVTLLFQTHSFIISNLIGEQSTRYHKKSRKYFDLKNENINKNLKS